MGENKVYTVAVYKKIKLHKQPFDTTALVASLNQANCGNYKGESSPCLSCWR